MYIVFELDLYSDGLKVKVLIVANYDRLLTL